MTIAIAKLAEELGKLLKEQGLKLATAESCTGGGLSYWITSVPGSSDWFERGYITYSDSSKTEMLGVKPRTLSTFGAVSEQAALEMAEGVIKQSHVDVSIAITGIAGPTGGSPQKPIGTVWIAWAKRDEPTEVRILFLTGTREEIRLQSIERALANLITRLKQKR